MVFKKIEIHTRNIETRIKSLKKDWKIPEEDKKDLLRFIEELGLGKINKGNKISESRQLKYLDILKVPLEYFNKTTAELTIKDIESFDNDITSNKIKSIKNKPYEHSTKADIRRILKIYLKWKLGEAKATELSGWLDTKQKKKTPEYLTEEQVNKLLKACKNAKDRFLIAVLFDSGARAEEFFNLRYEDIEMPKDSSTYVRVTLKEEYSKTSGRVISLYWDKTLEAVRDYLKERELEGIKTSEQIFKDNYDNARIFLARLGIKVLSKRVYFHLFRHSSATFYATKLNRQQLCYRYGWKFSSDMVDTYISRAGMQNEELDNQFEQTEISDLKKQMEKQKRELDMLKDLFNKSIEKGEEVIKKVRK